VIPPAAGSSVPSIAGRSPIYLARQMFDIKHGVRGGANVALMQGTVAKLTDEDIINLSAYPASLAREAFLTGSHACPRALQV
jgi:cytochrome c553